MFKYLLLKTRRSIIKTTINFCFNFLIKKQETQQLNNLSGVDSFISRPIRWQTELEKGEKLPTTASSWNFLFLTHRTSFTLKTIKQAITNFILYSELVWSMLQRKFCQKN